MSYSDAEWEARLAELQKLDEAEDVARAQAERDDPAIVLSRRQAERRRVIESAAAELRGCGVPELTVEPFMLGKALETSGVTRVRQWKHTRSWMMVLSGPGGRGKDGAMASYVFEDAVKRAEAGRGIPRASKCWLSAYDIAALGGYGKADELARVEIMPLLFIEELGTETPRLDLLFNILNKRYAARLRTLATTNLNAADFGAYAGPRIMDRINSGGVFCGITGPDLRKVGYDGDHGLLPIGVEAPRHHSEPEERTGHFTVSASPYRLRIRSPRTKAQRRQLAFPFNQVA